MKDTALVVQESGTYGFFHGLLPFRLGVFARH